MRNKALLLTTLFCMLISTAQAQTLELKKDAPFKKITQASYVSLNNANPTFTFKNLSQSGYNFVVQVFEKNTEGGNSSSIILSCNGVNTLIEPMKGIATCWTGGDIVLSLPQSTPGSESAYVGYTLEF